MTAMRRIKKAASLLALACMPLASITPGKVWFGIACLAEDHGTDKNGVRLINGLGIVEAAKWGAIVGMCDMGPIGSALVGFGVAA
jgi:hypothetical protein